MKTLYIPIDTTIFDVVECPKLVKRGDILKLQIKVFTDGVLRDLTGQNIDIILQKSDGTLIENTIDIANISNGVVTAILDVQATVVAGLVSGELQLSDENGQESTNTFTFEVNSSLADGVIEVSKDDINTLNQLRDLIATGEATISEYETHILAIANSIEAVEALENIKAYIDTNLAALQQENAEAIVNIANETTQNNQAVQNISDLTAKNSTATSNISALDAKNSTASSNITSLDAKNSTASTNISALDAKNSTASTNISNLDTKNATATSNINALDSENDRTEINISALESFGDATTLLQDTTALKSEIQTARDGEANLGARLDKVDASLSEKANNSDVIGDNNIYPIYVAPFFNSNTDQHAFLYTSSDGITFNKNSFSLKNDENLRDGDLIFKNETFYLLAGRNTWTGEFTVRTSKNLVDWESHNISCGLLTSNFIPYASEWFEDDDGKLYVLVPIQVGWHTDTIHRLFDNYIIECTNLETMQFGTPRKLELGTYNLIDPHIFKKDGLYYLFIKTEDGEYANQTAGRIQIWTSSDLTNWSLSVVEITTLNGGMYEAPCITEINETYYLYVDNYGNDDYAHSQSWMHYCTSIDLLNWSEPTRISSNSPTRHGSIRQISDAVAVQIINDYMKYIDNFIVHPDLKAGITDNKYIELFEINFDRNYRTVGIDFIITDVQGGGFYSKFSLSVNYKPSGNVISFHESYYANTLSNNICVIDCGNGLFKVYLKTGSITSFSPTLKIISSTYYEAIVKPSNTMKYLNSMLSGTEYKPTALSAISTPIIAVPTATNCTIKTGAYYKVGRTITLNIRISSTITASTANTTVLTGLPKPIDKSMTYIPCTVLDLTNNAPKYGYVTANGDVGVYGLANGVDYMINAVYISE